MPKLKVVRNIVRDHNGELLDLADMKEGVTYDYKALFDDSDQMADAAEALEDAGVIHLATDIVDGQCTMFLSISEE
jgi:hypothetical protein